MDQQQNHQQQRRRGLLNQQLSLFSLISILCYFALFFLLIFSTTFVDGQQRSSSSSSRWASQQPQPPRNDYYNYYSYAPTTTQAPPPPQQQRLTGGFRGLSGSYCSTLPAREHCCSAGPVPQRSDDRCGVALHGTMCYCDQFCDRWQPHPAGAQYFDYGDCCPDYWSYCSARRQDRAAGENRRQRYGGGSAQTAAAPQSRRSGGGGYSANVRSRSRQNNFVDDYDQHFLEEQFGSGADDNNNENEEDERLADDDLVAVESRSIGNSQVALDFSGKYKKTLARKGECVVRTRDGLQHIPAGKSARLNCNTCACVSKNTNNTTAAPQLKCTQRLCLIEPLLIDKINSDYGAYGWQATNYTPYWSRTLAWGLLHRLGTLKPSTQNEESQKFSSENATEFLTVLQQQEQHVPDEFDARDQWPRTIAAIMDQGACAASWAYSTVQTAQDRYNIAKMMLNQKQHLKSLLSSSSVPQSSSASTQLVQFSVEHLVACDKKRQQHGCGGGSVDKAWQYMQRQGVVNERCYPTDIDWLTTFQSHSSTESKWSPTCKIGQRQQNGLLPLECPNSVSSDTNQNSQWQHHRSRSQHHLAHRYVARSVEYLNHRSEIEIQLAIMRSGPVQAIIRVQPDFFMYADGVYSYTQQLERNLLGGKYANALNVALEGHHAVRIIGWGVDKSSGRPLKYWECANSWGTWWGREGYVRIRRGAQPSESDVESFIISACVERQKAPKTQQHSGSGGEGGFEKPSPTSSEFRHEKDFSNDYDMDYQSDQAAAITDIAHAMPLIQLENSASNINQRQIMVLAFSTSLLFFAFGLTALLSWL